MNDKKEAERSLIIRTVKLILIQLSVIMSLPITMPLVLFNEDFAMKMRGFMLWYEDQLSEVTESFKKLKKGE